MRRTLVVALSLSASLAALALPSRAAAQFPPEKLKNVKVLQTDIPVRALIDTMRFFTRALGVRCTYCHVGKESQPLAEYDFVSDEKPEKVKAREMLRMVLAINNEHLAKLPSRKEPRIVVNCSTCHRGVSEPRPIEQIVLTTYDAAGADSAEAKYRALRQRYYGRSAYDFGEVPLTEVAATLRDRKQLADAVRFYLLNTELVPTSGFAFRQAAEGQLALADTAAAIASLEKALGINANDPQAKQRIEMLKKKP